MLSCQSTSRVCSQQLRFQLTFTVFNFRLGKQLKTLLVGQTQQAVGRGQSIQKKEKLPSISEIFLALERERDFFPGKPLQLN